MTVAWFVIKGTFGSRSTESELSSPKEGSVGSVYKFQAMTADKAMTSKHSLDLQVYFPTNDPHIVLF